MRRNIRDIMTATNCSEAQADLVEREIDRLGLLDWPHETQAQIAETALRVHTQLTEADHYRFPKTYNGV